MDEKNWISLLTAIKNQRCTPFLGSEIMLEKLFNISKELAEEFGYPLQDPENLARVSQFIATERDIMCAKDNIVKKLKELASPDFEESEDPYCVLADLPLPLYITTNYVNFLVDALKSRPRYKDAKYCLCKWDDTAPDSSVLEPSVSNPIVYHLYGHIDVPQSLVVTEDDYLDFLINTSVPKVINSRIEQSFGFSFLLFLGYRLFDLEFRILLRRLTNSYTWKNPYSKSKAHISVQVVTMGSTANNEQKNKIQTYLNRYCENLNIQVFWGTCRQFISELRRRWENFKNVK
jgi:hypothetical protein